MKLEKPIYLMPYGYIRVAAAFPRVHVADPAANVAEIKKILKPAYEDCVSVLVLPELCVTGYTCGDLFMQRLLLDKAMCAFDELRQETANYRGMMVAVGLPVEENGSIYNCAALILNGEVIGVVAKTYLPNYGEFYEKRWFASAPEAPIDCYAFGRRLQLGGAQVFDVDGVKVGIEICEDLWSPNPPSTRLALGGAEIILNLSASNEVIGKHDYLVNLIRQQSARLNCGYVYSSAGPGESSTDLVYAGNGIIAECGKILAETPRFTGKPEMAVSDIDLDVIRHERLFNSSWRDASRGGSIPAVISRHSLQHSELRELLRAGNPEPFVPAGKTHRSLRCAEIISIQSSGLQQRLRATGCKKLVVGISGGLDSTLALLVAHHAFKALSLDLKGIIGVTMPGFGTTDRTKDNSTELMNLLGVTAREISISKAVTQHFADIGQDADKHDVTYENSQARERTQILMDLANKEGGMVLGTGDLSELALGWCTYNGDHMSMYAVNSSVPKTLVKHLVQYFADTTENKELSGVLCDIIDTPISPELLPPSEGQIAQVTEDLVGPYKLHDFVLYHVLRYGLTPRKIYLLACATFRGEFTPEVIKHWMKVFCRRFFNQQFKRSCMPDGPKVGSVCLSPRGDWRMPSDASAACWLKECEEL